MTRSPMRLPTLSPNCFRFNWISSRRLRASAAAAVDRQRARFRATDHRVPAARPRDPRSACGALRRGDYPRRSGWARLDWQPGFQRPASMLGIPGTASKVRRLFDPAAHRRSARVDHFAGNVAGCAQDAVAMAGRSAEMWRSRLRIKLNPTPPRPRRPASEGF